MSTSNGADRFTWGEFSFEAQTKAALSYREKLRLMLSGEWDESAHPRDEAGRFDDGGGSDAHAKIDQKREAFHALIKQGDVEAEHLDTMRTELNAAWKVWADEIKDRPKPLKPDGAAAKKLESYQRAKALEEAFHKQYDDVQRGAIARTDAMRTMLKVPLDQQSEIEFEAKAGLHPALKTSADRALATFKQFDGSGALVPIKFPAESVKTFRDVFGEDAPIRQNRDGSYSIAGNLTIERAEGGRANAVFNGIQISGGSHLDSQVYHEIAHHIEMRSGAVREAAIAFREKMATQPREVYKLNTVNPSLGDDEIAVRGKFPDPYTGKLYPHDIATEIISTGVESYLTDPVGFAKDRPEHFDLIFDVMHGKYRGK